MRKTLPRLVGLLVMVTMLVGLVGVIASPAGAQVVPTGAPKVSFDTEINTGVGTLGITALDDPTAAGYTAVTDFAQVTVKSTEGGDTEVVLLTETGNLTGIFKGTITTAAATAAVGTANNGTLSVGIQAGGTGVALGATPLAATVSSLVDRLDVAFDDRMAVAPAATDIVFGKALIDAEAPKTTVALGAYDPVAKAIPVTVNATDDKNASGFLVYPTAAANGGFQAAGEASGVVRLEISVNGGPWTIVANQIPGIAAGPVVISIDAPTEGTYKVQGRAIDRAGNVEVAGAGATLIADVTKPVVSAPTAARAEGATTDADATKVVAAAVADPGGRGGHVTLKATVAETGAGITAKLTSITLDAAGKVSAKTYAADPGATGLVTTNAVANLALATEVSLKPSDAALQAAVDAALAASTNVGVATFNAVAIATGALTKGGVNAGAPITLAIVGTGDWSQTVQVPVGTAAGAKTIGITATDINANASTAVNIVLTVVADATAPVVANSAFTPGPAYPANITVTEAQVGEIVTVVVNVTDDLSGIPQGINDTQTIGVTGDFTALAPTDYATAYAKATTTTPEAYTMNGAAPVAAVLVKIPFYYSGTPGKYVARVQIGAAVAAGDKSIPLTVIDNKLTASANSATGSTAVKVVTERSTMTIALAAGLNFVSIPKPLTTADIYVALANIPDKVTKVVSFMGGVAKVVAPKETTAGSGVWLWKTSDDPALALNTLDSGVGYIFDMKAAATVTFTFKTIDPTAPPAPLSLPAGWSLVGFSTRSVAANLRLDVYLSGLPWKVIYNYPGWGQVVPLLVGVQATNWPNMAGVDPLLVLGKSYWVYTSADGQIVQ